MVPTDNEQQQQQEDKIGFSIILFCGLWPFSISGGCRKLNFRPFLTFIFFCDFFLMKFTFFTSQPFFNAIKFDQA